MVFPTFFFHHMNLFGQMLPNMRRKMHEYFREVFLPPRPLYFFSFFLSLPASMAVHKCRKVCLCRRSCFLAQLVTIARLSGLPDVLKNVATLVASALSVLVSSCRFQDRYYLLPPFIKTPFVCSHTTFSWPHLIPPSPGLPHSRTEKYAFQNFQQSVPDLSTKFFSKICQIFPQRCQIFQQKMPNHPARVAKSSGKSC